MKKRGFLIFLLSILVLIGVIYFQSDNIRSLLNNISMTSHQRFMYTKTSSLFDKHITLKEDGSLYFTLKYNVKEGDVHFSIEDKNDTILYETNGTEIHVVETLDLEPGRYRILAKLTNGYAKNGSFNFHGKVLQ